ncbi:MAG: NAD(P)-dependent glycerol-3-phosphate dehydrogenase [Planctomycetes bacterium]|nr:NAD(P)-dependent glycerol-3-phosphate dehydrogenase [Planctomycetota bacterium]
MTPKRSRVLIFGSGSFAVGLAHVLRRRGAEVWVLCRREERVREIIARRHGSLPGIDLAEGIRATLELSGDAPSFDFAISAVPTQRLRSSLELRSSELPAGIPWISASKGIELRTGFRPSEIIAAFGLDAAPAVLSGPSHAEEVVRDVPTAVVLATEDSSRGPALQSALSTERFRVYWNRDPVGVEWAGALKNVIALAAGIAVGHGFGDNTLAALVTRGAVEMARFGVAMGGQRDTFFGLAGIGDLMVTCFSEHSRNRSVGVRMGRGETVASILEGMTQVAEGISTATAVAERARAIGIELPIADEVDRILSGMDVEQGVQALLSRSLKPE